MLSSMAAAWGSISQAPSSTEWRYASPASRTRKAMALRTGEADVASCEFTITFISP